VCLYVCDQEPRKGRPKVHPGLSTYHPKLRKGYKDREVVAYFEQCLNIRINKRNSDTRKSGILCKLIVLVTNPPEVIETYEVLFIKMLVIRFQYLV
jgi:hypothetical protein